MKVGTFITDIIKSEIDEPIEVTYEINKEFIDEIYKFMLSGENTMRNLKDYFETRLHYQSKGMEFDLDMVEVFLDQHRT